MQFRLPSRLLPLAAFALAHVALAESPPHHPAPLTRGQHIFFSGHSFHFHVPEMLPEIAKAGGYEDEVTVGKSLIGGSKVIQHWETKGQPSAAQQAVESGAVEVQTMTPIYLPDEGLEKFATLGHTHNPHYRGVVQEFWLPFDIYEPHFYDPPKIPRPTKVDHNAATGAGLRQMHERYFREMDEAITAINSKLGAQVLYVVPMGQAVIALREKIIAGQAPGLKTQEDLFTDALGHPKPPLQVMITYAFYSVIYKKSPVGLPVPTVLAKAGLTASDAEALNKLLQEIAWHAVLQHPLSGVK